MNRPRSAYVAGVSESDLGRTPHLNELSMQAQAAGRALDDCGLKFADVDALFVAGGIAQHPTLALAEYLGIQPHWLDGTDIGGSSFEAHVGHAAAAIGMGLIDVALITYGSTQRTRGSRRQARAVDYGGQFAEAAGLPTPVGAYALAAARHMHVYGTTSEQLAEVAVAARAWAGLNECAYRRDPITVDDVLASPMVADPLRVLDCCLVTDGGGAVVVVAEDRLTDLKVPGVRIAGYGESTTHSSIVNNPDLLTTAAAASGATALRQAGVTVTDVDVFQIYDSFTITVLLTLEALGICGPGESGAFVGKGRIAPGGEIALNTSGGGLSYCHPGKFGIFLLIEAVRQLRGTCGARQVQNAQLALVNGTGGTLSSTATVILEATS